MIERAAILARGSTLKLDWELPSEDADVAGVQRSSGGGAGSPANRPESAAATTLEEVERRHIIETLRRTGGVIEGTRGAASLLKLRPSTLRARMKKLGISRAPAQAP